MEVQLAVRCNRQIKARVALALLMVLSACIEVDPSFDEASPTVTNSTVSDMDTAFSSSEFSSSLTLTTSTLGDETTSNSTEDNTETTTTGTTNCVSTLCFANNEDRTFDNGRRVTGGVNVAYRMSGDEVDHWITGVEIFTGEVNANSRLVIRDSMNNLPRNSMGSKDFTIQLPNTWQGVTFDEPIALPAGTDFWIDWFSVDGVQATVSQSGSSVPYAWRVNEQSLWAPDGTRLLMVRVTCCDP